ncbi:hypothetical protein BDZ90DRAFT_281628 [Jaminaea rosea]|uniref:Tesmin/TSO1-like CXC domain-containing protein n=1 Tax=Jaminaea rosea TaxID=1569628 RepID=A0A316UKG4_9BASI|nr:hypothetical protein BDZ90DRAFT_281628 [Jaminaea rosea]PWN25424.1 hypothetical protein BDZ90DRAFT_281628 [Jaminaea rosea]
MRPPFLSFIFPAVLGLALIGPGATGRAIDVLALRTEGSLSDHGYLVHRGYNESVPALRTFHHDREDRSSLTDTDSTLAGRNKTNAQPKQSTRPTANPASNDCRKAGDCECFNCRHAVDLPGRYEKQPRIPRAVSTVSTPRDSDLTTQSDAMLTERKRKKPAPSKFCQCCSSGTSSARCCQFKPSCTCSGCSMDVVGRDHLMWEEAYDRMVTATDNVVHLQF